MNNPYFEITFKLESDIFGYKWYEITKVRYPKHIPYEWKVQEVHCYNNSQNEFIVKINGISRSWRIGDLASELEMQEVMHCMKQLNDIYTQFIVPPIDLVVTKNASLVEYFISKGLITPQTEVREYIEHAEQVDGRHVLGVLPMHFAARCSRFSTLHLNIPIEFLENELSTNEITLYASKISTYIIESSEILSPEKLRNISNKLLIVSDQPLIIDMLRKDYGVPADVSIVSTVNIEDIEGRIILGQYLPLHLAEKAMAVYSIMLEVPEELYAQNLINDTLFDSAEILLQGYKVHHVGTLL